MPKSLSTRECWTVARVLGRSPSTVSHESAATPLEFYRACTALTQAAARARLSPAHFWIPSWAAAGNTWAMAVHLSRLPDASDVRILMTWVNKLSAETIWEAT